MVIIDLTDKRFGRLLVKRRIQQVGNPCWLCKRDCGNEKKVSGAKLRNGKTNSCGCLRRETASLHCINMNDSNIPFTDRAIGQLFYRYQQSAAKRGYTFELTLSEFTALTQRHCHYCGVAPINVFRQSRKSFEDQTFRYNGIDRFDNSIGYKLTNCVPCCSACNRAKGTQTGTQFTEWIQRLVEWQMIH